MTTIYIPTRHRVHSQQTLRFLPARWQDRTVLVCAKSEEKALREATGHPRIMTHELDNLPAIRRFILEEHDVDEHGPYIVQADDDLGFVRRRDDDPKKFRSPAEWTDKDFDEMMEDGAGLLQFSILAGIGRRLRGNFSPQPYLMNQMSYGWHWINVPLAREHGVWMDTALLNEDVYAELQCLTLGYPVVKVNRFVAYDVKGFNAPGGCSDYRTNERLTESIQTIVDRFPDYVKLADRKGLPVPRVQWKKAFEAGTAWRAENGLPPVEIPAYVTDPYAGDLAELL